MVDELELVERVEESEKARRERLLAAREENRRLREDILARRGGEPIDVQSALDELRGRTNGSSGN